MSCKATKKIYIAKVRMWPTLEIKIATYKNKRMFLIHEIIPRPGQTASDAPASEPLIDAGERIWYVVP